MALEQKDYPPRIYRRTSGNCNFYYITNLSAAQNFDPALAVAQILTVPPQSSSFSMSGKASEPVYQMPDTGIYLFAQGSDHDPKLNPYGPKMKAFIEETGLGTVHEHSAKNPRHTNNVGTLYVWVIDHAACEKWWKLNVAQNRGGKGASILPYNY